MSGELLSKGLRCTVQCTVYSVRCTVYGLQCTVYSVHCILYSVRQAKVCEINYYRQEVELSSIRLPAVLPSASLVIQLAYGGITPGVYV